MANDLLRERLPPGCHLGVTQDGRVFFINDHSRTTSWLHPVSLEPVLTGLSKDPDLPKGWEQDVTNDGTIYYIDHNRQLTTFDHPLLGRPPESFRNAPYTSENEPSSPTSPGIRTEEKDNFKRGTFKQRSVKAPSSKRNPNSEVVKSGWLLRLETSGLTKSWKRRWCVLADFALFIYKGEDESVTLNSVLLPSYRINPCTETDNIKRNFVFKVEHENTKTLYFAAEDPNECNAWMSLLRQAAMMNGNGFQRDSGYMARHMKSFNKPSSLPHTNSGSSYTAYGDPAESPFIAPNDPFGNMRDNSFQKQNIGPNQHGSNRNSLSNSSHGSQNFRPNYNSQSFNPNQSLTSGNSGGPAPGQQNQPLRDGFAPDSARNSLAKSDSSRNGHNSYSPIQAERQRSRDGQGQWVNGVYQQPPKDDSYSDIDTPVKMLHKWDEGFPSMDTDRLKHSSFVELPDNSKGKHPETFNIRSKSHENFLRQPDSRMQVRPGLLTQQQTRASQPQDLRRSMTSGQQQRNEGDGSMNKSSPSTSPPHSHGPSQQTGDPLRGSLRDTRDQRQQFPPGHDRRSYTSSSSSGAPPPGFNSSFRNSGQGQADPRQTSQGSLSRPHQHTDLHLNLKQRPDGSNNSLQSSTRGHTYVNFPNRSASDGQQHLGQAPLPGRPPYPSAVRQQIVEELAETKTPVTQNDFLTSSKMNTQRMQEPAYFQYPTPREKQLSNTLPWEQGTQPNSAASSLSRNQPSSRLSDSSHSSHPSAAEDQGYSPGSPQSRNMMDPEAQKLRLAYERVSSLRLAPDKEDLPYHDNDLMVNGRLYPAPAMESLDALEATNRAHRSQEELSTYGKISPPMGMYFRIPDEPKDLYQRGSAFRPPSTPSGSVSGLDSLQRMRPFSSERHGMFPREMANFGTRTQDIHDYADDVDYYNLTNGSAVHRQLARAEVHAGWLASDYHFRDQMAKYEHTRHMNATEYIEDKSDRHKHIKDQWASYDDQMTRQECLDDQVAKDEHFDEAMPRYDHLNDEMAKHEYLKEARKQYIEDQKTVSEDQMAKYGNRNGHFTRHENNRLRTERSENRLDNYAAANGQLAREDRKNNRYSRHSNGHSHALDHFDNRVPTHSHITDHMNERVPRPFTELHNVYQSTWFGPYCNGLRSNNVFKNVMGSETQEKSEWPRDGPYSTHLTAPPRRQPPMIHTVKEDPNMSDREVLETNLQKVIKKNPLAGPRLRMSISAGDLIGKTHDELVLFLIQLRRNQATLEKMRDWYKTQLDQRRPLEMEYRRQVNQTGVIKDRRLMDNHQNFLNAKGQMEEIENKLEVYKPIINLLDNMVTMGSLYGGDNLMLATQYRKHLLRPDQYQPPKKMLEFSRKNQEDRLIQNTEAQLKELSSDEVDLEEKIDRLNDLDRLLQEQSFKVSSYKEDKELMERALSDAFKQQDQYRNDPREMRRLTEQQRTLEKEISRVTQQLAEASKELEETTAQNNKLEQEVALLRTKVHGELTRSKSTPSLASENVRTKMLMEKELAKVEGMMQGLNQKGASLSQAMKTIRRSSSSSQLAAALEKEESKKKVGSYLETDIDSGQQIDLATVVDVASPDSYKPSINHHRQNAGTQEDWDIEDADQNTKQFYGLVPREKPKGLTVRDVKRQSEQRKERLKKEDDLEEVKLQVSNVDNEDTSIIHARIASDPSGKHSSLTQWDSAQPLYENLPKYTPKSSVSTTSETQSAPGSRRTSLILMAPKPFTPYQEKSARPFRSELALNAVGEPQFSSVKPNVPASSDFARPYHSIEALNSPAKEDGQVVMDKNNNGLMSSLETNYPANSFMGQQQKPSDQFIAKSYVPVSSNSSGSLTLQKERKQNDLAYPDEQDPHPSAAHIQRPSGLSSLPTSGAYTARPWTKSPPEWDSSLLNVKRSPRGRHMTISSSEPLKLEMNPTRHSAAGDLMTSRLIDDVPDIVKSSQTKMDQIDTDMIDREILFKPEKVFIPERYDPVADAENLTEEDRLRRLEKAERIKRVLTSQSVLSMSQQDLSKLPPEDIHSKVEKEKNERAHYMNLHQELARQVTLQTKKQAAARRKTWSGDQIAEIKRQYEESKSLSPD
ncbi:uncharacterized protein LOC106074128 isoform X3 [Biomphalaria glabrata]|uniref:Uncharacterized protein LOC106074128 isoform X3 n=1 Tax=Biomphalaria glabrata TaxID=6526 RepID=A0A9W3BHN3_BIOGL|nr:uncharacterized protein LOC106074128 isoform X3 [Biomphalaria glabrata]